jgi:uncharacterized membrane protein YeaQ/YmgE (transglycosylase-associated protein family)
MFIASWIVIGLVLGSIARIAMPGPAAGGMPVAILIGVIGASIGGVIGATVFDSGTVPLKMSALMAANGALYPLFLYRCFALRFENREQIPSQPMEDCKVALAIDDTNNVTSDVTTRSLPPTEQLESTTSLLRVGQ